MLFLTGYYPYTFITCVCLTYYLSVPTTPTFLSVIQTVLYACREEEHAHPTFVPVCLPAIFFPTCSNFKLLLPSLVGRRGRGQEEEDDVVPGWEEEEEGGFEAVPLYSSCPTPLPCLSFYALSFPLPAGEATPPSPPHSFLLLTSLPSLIVEEEGRRRRIPFPTLPACGTGGEEEEVACPFPGACGRGDCLPAVFTPYSPFPLVPSLPCLIPVPPLDTFPLFFLLPAPCLPASPSSCHYALHTGSRPCLFHHHHYLYHA